MASFMYNAGAAKIWNRYVAGTAGNLKARLVMTNTTVDTENDAKDHLDDFTTMDTHDGAGYVDKACSIIDLPADDANNRGILDINDITWTALGTGTRAIEGALIYDEVTGSDAGRIPVAFLDTTNISSNGGDITLTFNAAGVLAITCTGAP